jgi:predicted  nucleic acid-binding Zn-ribbon protein
MAHKCVRCGKIYPTGDRRVLEGCECGSRLFFYISDEKLDKLKKENVSKEDYEKLERDLYEILNLKNDKIIILPIETIRKISEGKYLIDLSKLFENKSIVVKIEEGKYLIDLK